VVAPSLIPSRQGNRVRTKPPRCHHARQTASAAAARTERTHSRPQALPADADEANGAVASVRFVNTYWPVVPLYETMAAVAGDTYGWRVVVCVSRGVYRATDQSKAAGAAGIGTELVWVPNRLRNNSVGSNSLFSLLTPFRLMGSLKSSPNIFLTHPPLFYVIGGGLSRRRGCPTSST
jgi:hypothetical protein